MKKGSKERKIILVIITIIIVVNFIVLLGVRDYLFPEFLGTKPERIWSFITFFSVLSLILYFVFYESNKK